MAAKHIAQSFSAAYRHKFRWRGRLEWAAAVVFGGGLGAAFLGTQGDEWDAHRDMALAGIGGLIAILLVYARNRSTRDRSGDRELP